jgi:hypothetical protein
LITDYLAGKLNRFPVELGNREEGIGNRGILANWGFFFLAIVLQL